MMNKSLLILKTEYLKRIRKKSFIIMTIVMPLLVAASIFVPFWLAQKGNTSQQRIAIYDASGLFLGRLKNSPNYSFTFIPQQEYDSLRPRLNQSSFTTLLAVPLGILSDEHVHLYATRVIPLDVKREITDQLNQIVQATKRNQLLKSYNIEGLEQKLAAVHTSIQLETIRLSDEGNARDSSTELAMAVSYITAFAIYMFVLIYGTMVMRGITEEKSNRIVEILISSVKPRQLMFGKIAGIGLVGLTQLGIWALLAIGTLTGAGLYQTTGSSSVAVTHYLDFIYNLNFPLLIGSFILYFLLGFLIYASLLGAIGAAINHEEDAQQLTFPVFIPLIFAIVLISPVIMNPDSSLAFWTSMIPVTSPIIMMARIPMGVPLWQLFLSLFILLLSTALCILAAAKIYRTGILMYGKKVSLKEIYRWLFFH